MNFKRPKWKIPVGLFQAVYSFPAWQKAAICLLSCAIPIGLFWYFFLADRIKEIDDLSERIPKLSQEVAELEARSRQIPKLEEELKIMQGILQKALKLLPEKKDIPSVLTEISTLGNEARLDFLSFKPQKEHLKEFYAAIPVKMEFNGPFHNIVAFFDSSLY